MKVSYEIVKPDDHCSFRTIYNDQPTNEVEWEYHYHPEVELVCVLSGNGSRHVGYHKGNFENGDLVLIGSNVPHSGFGLNSVDPHREIVIQIKEEKLRDNFGSLKEFKKIKLLLERAKFGLLFDAETKNEIRFKLIQLMELTGYQKMIQLLSIFCELAEKENYTLLNQQIMPHTIIAKHRKRIQLIFSLVEENYMRDISVSEAAKLSNLTLPAFCNFFKKTTQLSFTEFVNQYRVNKACLLIMQDKSISEACFEVGFNNVSYFNRMFKKFTGKTPSEFKQFMG